MRRSQLFVPANEEKKIRKSTSLNADSIILDLEDAVPESGKAEARNSLAEILDDLSWDSKRELCVRINKKSNGEYSHEDLDAVRRLEKVRTIVLPKLETRADEIHDYTGKSLIALVETARGFYNIRKISETKGMVAIAFGPQDYANSVRGNLSAYVSNSSILTTIVSAARSNDLDPIDGVYFELTNLSGFRKAAEAARDLGCSGKQVVHPSQIEIANEVFSPSQQELEDARQIVAVYEKAGLTKTGAIRVDDRLVDAVHYRRAKDLLGRTEQD